MQTPAVVASLPQLGEWTEQPGVRSFKVGDAKQLALCLDDVFAGGDESQTLSLRNQVIEKGEIGLTIGLLEALIDELAA